MKQLCEGLMNPAIPYTKHRKMVLEHLEGIYTCPEGPMLHLPDKEHRKFKKKEYKKPLPHCGKRPTNTTYVTCQIRPNTSTQSLTQVKTGGVHDVFGACLPQWISSLPCAQQSMLEVSFGNAPQAREWHGFRCQWQ